jgi:hypothetical protein
MRSPERRSFSLPRGRVIWLTAVLATVMLATAALVRVDTRDAQGTDRKRTTLDVWWSTLDRLPVEAPSFLTRSVLAVLLLAAVVALAFVIASTLELGIGDPADDDDAT